MSDITRTINRIRQQRRAILQPGDSSGNAGNGLDLIKRIMVINSSSRSGSSLLYALLGKLPQVISLTGEASPFYKLNTDYGSFNPHLSEHIPTALLDRVIDFASLAADFSADIYSSVLPQRCSEIDKDSYLDGLMLRFLLQWTDIEPEQAELRTIMSHCLDRFCREQSLFDTENFYLQLLEQLSRRWPGINPFYYDIGTDRVALHFPSLDIPSGPPVSLFTIEEPPFILLQPRRRADRAELTDKILLLKSTVDCYRMNLLEKLFPNAELKVIHLVRNPAATINGIFDGWHHRGFFSHNLGSCFGVHSHATSLNIKGYSDLYQFGSHWWNFDLPSGWDRYANSDLVDVCAFQWRSANGEILQHLAHGGRSSIRVGFEEIIRNYDSRCLAFGRMLDFMGISRQELSCLGLDRLPVVQSTLPPQLYRWKKRQDLIERLLDDPELLAMSSELGYRRDSMESWL